MNIDSKINKSLKNVNQIYHLFLLLRIKNATINNLNKYSIINHNQKEVNVVLPENHQRWREIASGKVYIEFHSLAVKIMLGRILTSTRNDPSHDNLQKRSAELRDFFVKNERIVQGDLAKINGQEVR